MAKILSVVLFLSAAITVNAQAAATTGQINSQSISVLTGSRTAALSGDDAVPTHVTYITYNSTSTANTFSTLTASNGTATGTSATYTMLTGASNKTATATTSSTQPKNTQPCNNYVEFCNRKYSNITEVCAHNSPFSRKGNAGSNQAYPVTTQLNDGVRMLQGQTHWNATTGVINFCHTTCDLLNAGTMESYLKDVTSWLDSHPYEVVTILIGNSDYIGVGNYTAPIQASGISKYAFVPPKVPMELNDWPTLGELIIRNKRVVIFMDYQANQTAVDYIIDEFSNMWETPFSPTNNSFPCTVERPPNQPDNVSRDRLYIANHNLNIPVSITGLDLLLPNTPELNVTNNVTGYGSLGLMSDTCTARWGRPPNFLLVDYYNVGDGTVFEVAAEANGVNYTRSCCGSTSGAVSSLIKLGLRQKIMIAVTSVLLAFLL